MRVKPMLWDKLLLGITGKQRFIKPTHNCFNYQGTYRRHIARIFSLSGNPVWSVEHYLACCTLHVPLNTLKKTVICYKISYTYSFYTAVRSTLMLVNLQSVKIETVLSVRSRELLSRKCWKMVFFS